LARNGAAIYSEHRSQITMGIAAAIEFINNTASVYGGAI